MPGFTYSTLNIVIICNYVVYEVYTCSITSSRSYPGTIRPLSNSTKTESLAILPSNKKTGFQFYSLAVKSTEFIYKLTLFKYRMSQVDVTAIHTLLPISHD